MRYDHVHPTTTPRKLSQVWRQLWRVVERSDVLIQVVDARNPLMFRCADLESYVTEINPAKECLLLVNKADFLSAPQVGREGARREWVGQSK